MKGVSAEIRSFLVKAILLSILFHFLLAPLLPSYNRLQTAVINPVNHLMDHLHKIEVHAGKDFLVATLTNMSLKFVKNRWVAIMHDKPLTSSSPRRFKPIQIRVDTWVGYMSIPLLPALVLATPGISLLRMLTCIGAGMLLNFIYQAFAALVRLHNFLSNQTGEFGQVVYSEAQRDFLAAMHQFNDTVGVSYLPVIMWMILVAVLNKPRSKRGHPSAQPLFPGLETPTPPRNHSPAKAPTGPLQRA